MARASFSRVGGSLRIPASGRPRFSRDGHAQDLRRAHRLVGADLGRTARPHLALREIENAYAASLSPARASVPPQVSSQSSRCAAIASRSTCSSEDGAGGMAGNLTAPFPPPRSLVAERFDRVELRRAHRREHPEQHAGDRAGAERRDDRPSGGTDALIGVALRMITDAMHAERPGR